ncbi:MAG: hypothetical protein ACFFD2_13005 [Promethearchaeota archaeon]
MNNPKKESSLNFDENRMTAMLSYMELSVSRGNFKGIYLLSEDWNIIKKVEGVNLSIDVESLRLAIIHAVKVAIHPIELIMNYKNYTVVVQPLVLKEKPNTILNISYIAVVFPPTKTFRKNFNNLIRNLLIPFKKKVVSKKDEIDKETKKRFAVKILEDLNNL